ncbi:MAG: C_GCAxxG_C_C family protein [Acidimicrobiia bacterium]|nr:C_GCAxxG_C_C family protein [Acidimicrobiia bacterium]
MPPQHREELLARAYELGFEYEARYRGCSQCVVAALQDTLGIRDDAVFKAATGLSGGGALTGAGGCGAFVGAVLVLGQLQGRERRDFADPEGVRYRTFDLVERLQGRFAAQFGSTICREVQAGVFGRSFDLRNPDDFARFEAAGAHKDKCPDVVGRAARLAVEIILEAGLAPDPPPADTAPEA